MIVDCILNKQRKRFSGQTFLFQTSKYNMKLKRIKWNVLYTLIVFMIFFFLLNMLFKQDS